jgi:hypothetical protein
MQSKPLLMRLLYHVADSGPDAPTGTIQPLRLEAGDNTQVGWLMEAGLGPLLYRSIGEGPHEALGPVFTELLLASDLAARLQHDNRVEAAAGLIDMGQQLGVRVVPLKGISLSEQHYPSGHLRPMGDIDVLIPGVAYAALERRMLANGYERAPGYVADASEAHGVPLYLPRCAVWVELHTALFPEDSPLRRNRLFGGPQLERELVSCTFAGRAVQRLSDEMQLIYAAAGWIRDMSSRDMHPSFLPPLFDAVYLLRGAGPRFDWDRLLRVLDNETAAASLCILLGYLARHGLHAPPREALCRLGVVQRLVGPLELRILHRVFDSRLSSGRRANHLFQSWHLFPNLIKPGLPIVKLLRLPWNVMFPPDRAARYQAGYQLARLARHSRRLFSAGIEKH